MAAGCEKVIDIDPSQSQRKVVVVADVEADSVVTARLTYSRFFLDDRPFEAIDGATVALTANGAATGAMTQAAGRYSNGYVARVGDSLELAVEVPGHSRLTGATKVPQMPQVEQVRATLAADGMTGQIRLRLNDPAGESNYYGVWVRYQADTLFEPTVDDAGRVGCDTLTEGIAGWCYLTSNDPLLFGEGSGMTGVVESDEGALQLHFTDHNIDGQRHDLKIDIEGIGGYPYSQDDGDSRIERRISTPRLTLEIASYSRDRYLYELTTAAYSYSELFGMFDEPVEVHSNIGGGGIGIFAARSRKKVEVAIDE